MDYITFADGTKIEIDEQSTLGAVTHVADSEAAAQDVCALVTKENISHVEFSSDEGGTYGVYDNLVIAAQPTRQDEVDEDGAPTGKVIVVISLRPQTELELRVTELEETQAIQDGAIEEIAEIVAGE